MSLAGPSLPLVEGEYAHAAVPSGLVVGGSSWCMMLRENPAHAEACRR